MNLNNKIPEPFYINNLKKQSEKYTLFITDSLENRIRYLCSQFPTTEWSGILFYTYQGSIVDNNLQLTCVDFYLMDIGTSGATDFDMSSEVISYMADNNLLDCQYGLIHSHHSMPTFFSSTDLNTLRIEGSERNHFLSLIVNNEGKYSAALTQKVTHIRNIEETCVYNSFDGKERSVEQIKKVENINEVYYYDLDVIINVTTSNISIINRIEEIKKNKVQKSLDRQTVIEFPKETKDNTLLPKSTNVIKLDKKDLNLVDNIILQLVSGYILASNNNKLDIQKLITSMPKLYGKKFKELMTYSTWVETYVPFVLDLETLELSSEKSKLILEEVLNKLTTFTDTNEYFAEILDQCESYYINLDY